MGILIIILGPAVTFLVGSFVIAIYYRQKNDNKRDAAKLILQEIRYAEQQIRNFRDSGSYPLSTKLLPTNSWHDKINLFVKDLSESEIDIISRFYSTTSYIDVLIGKISDQKNNAVVPVGTERGPQLTGQQSGSQPVPLAIPVETQVFEFNTQIILLEISSKVEFIYNTPAVDKLRVIAKKKKLLFF